MITVLIIDDHSLFRHGLNLAIKDRLIHSIVLESGSVERALTLLNAIPDLIFLDFQLNGMDGATGLPYLMDKWPAAKIYMLSSIKDGDATKRSIEAGALGFLDKSTDISRLVKIINELPLCTKENHSLKIDESKKCLLTKRQMKVLEKLKHGLSNKEISKEVFLSEFTVRGHVQEILRRLNASNRTQALIKAKSIGLIE